MVDHRSDICWLAWRLRRLPPCKVDHLAPLGHVEVMEGCVEGALEAQAGQLNLGKGEVVVMSFVALMWNRIVMVNGESPLQCIANLWHCCHQGAAFFWGCHDLSPETDKSQLILKLNNFILVKTLWIWETKKYLKDTSPQLRGGGWLWVQAFLHLLFWSHLILLKISLDRARKLSRSYFIWLDLTWSYSLLTDLTSHSHSLSSLTESPSMCATQSMCRCLW